MRHRRLLFLGAWALVALLTKTNPESAQEFSRLGTVESIVDRGTYQIDDSIFIGTIDKIYKDGHYYSHQPPLLSTLETPIYWLLHLPGTRFNNRGRLPMTYAFSLLTNGLAMAATVIVFANILELAAVEPPICYVLALLLPCGTWLLPYAVVTNSHGISGLLMAMLAWLLLLIEWHGASPRRALGIGAVLGLLATIELLPIVSFVPLTILYLLIRRRFDARAWMLFAVALAAPLIAHAIINFQITGDVVPGGFHSELFAYPGSQFDNDTLSGTLKHGSIGAAASYAWRSLFAGKAFFVFAPITLAGLVAGVIGWRWWRRRAPGVYAVLIGGSLLSLGVAVLMTNNFGGEAVGFRHAVYLSPAFAVLLLPWVAGDGRQRRAGVYVVLAIASVSTLSMLVLATRQPWFVLTLSNAPIGSWDQYVPIVAKIVRGTLFTP